MLIQPQTQEVLARERALLAEIGTFLTARGAPFDVLSLAQTALSALDETFLLVVVGEFNAGKSSFLNALLETDLLGVGVTPTTDRIYVLVNGPENGKLENTDDPFVMRLTLNSKQLEGLALVDTPGTNAVIRRHQVLTEGFLPRADLLLFLTSADLPFSESERQFLTLAKRWGRSVLIIINKADLLGTELERQEVQTFVEQYTRETLGLTPPTFMVSSRGERNGGDPGFKALRADLESRLNEKERTRLKLENPLNIAASLLEGELERVKLAREVLKEDFALLEGLEGETRLHSEDMSAELAGQLARLDAHLEDFGRRATEYIEDRMRIQKIGSLLRGKELEQGFEREAVADLPQRLEQTLSGAVDRLLERNLRFWEDTQGRLRQRQDIKLPETRFQMDRQNLMQNIVTKADVQLSSLTHEDFAQRFVADAQGALVTSGLTAVGGIGLGALTVALVSTTALDITGITAGITLTALGALVLPARRRAAVAKVRSSIENTRRTLHALISREYALEQERFTARLSDTMAPWTRFIRLERDKLEEGERGVLERRGKVEALRREILG